MHKPQKQGVIEMNEIEQEVAPLSRWLSTLLIVWVISVLLFYCATIGVYHIDLSGSERHQNSLRASMAIVGAYAVLFGFGCIFFPNDKVSNSFLATVSGLLVVSIGVTFWTNDPDIHSIGSLIMYTYPLISIPFLFFARLFAKGLKSILLGGILGVGTGIFYIQYVMKYQKTLEDFFGF